MLDYKHDRLDYGEQLCPPEGYRFDRALATAYSADLATLLSIPVALVYAQTLEGDLTGSRFQLLEAIKEFSGRVRIYHQAGQLHVPTKLNWLYAHLEDALVPVLPDDAFAAFHPKLWVIRYTPKEDSEDGLPDRFRIIILSRNLTFDRSWDVAASLDGEPTGAPRKENRPLVDFLRWVQDYSTTPWADQFLRELERVQFETPEPFKSHAFHPIGITGYSVNPTGTLTAWKTLVMSPFLHPEALRLLADHTEAGLFVFSEKRELEKMPTAVLESSWNYHLSDLVVEGEFLDNAEEGLLEPSAQHLHAKLFIFENRKGSRWFLGSANATRAALERNVEFMLELAGSSYPLKAEPRRNALLGTNGDNGPFVPFDASDGGRDDSEEQKLQQRIRLFEYGLLKAAITGKVEMAENGSNFDLGLTLDLRGIAPPAGLRATIQPFNVKSRPEPHLLRPGQLDACTFTNIGEIELSRFVHFRIESDNGELRHEFLLRVDLEGLPDDRLDNILRKIIDSRDKFFDYLRFLLADEITKEDLLEMVGGAPDAGTPDDSESWHERLPIYEQLLVTASRSPSKLRAVDELIRHLAADSREEKSVIPESFLTFWENFRRLLPPESPNKP